MNAASLGQTMDAASIGETMDATYIWVNKERRAPSMGHYGNEM